MTVFSLLSLLLILRLRPALLEHLAVHADRGQWRFELVADRGNEVLLLSSEIDLAQAEAIQRVKAAQEYEREYECDPAQYRGAWPWRQAVDAVNQFEAV